MADLDREVAGLRCRQVLALLGDYVDGELPEDHVQRVEAHLRGCDHCEKFGGAYSSMVTRLRSRLTRQPLGSEGRARLASRVKRAWESQDE